MMPQVDFYILDGDADTARLSVACKIAEKAMLSDMRVWLRTSDARETALLDDLLWTFSQGSFVPHRVVTETQTEAAIEPVLIGQDEPPASEKLDVLINLASSWPPDFDRYSRIAELVDADEERRRLGRERFREYRSRGCTLDSHQL
jgi:DNA polymerase-3 subunit chi